jgi:GntR family transcriptional regulator of arabinose operon
VAVGLCDNCYPEDDFSYVCLDDRAGGALAAEYLWRRGHRKIGVFFESDYQVKQARRLGAEAYLEDKGAPIPDRWKVGFTGQGPQSRASEAAAKLFSAEGELPTAVICSSDEDALHLIREAEAQGLRIPDDLSVVGFDNSKIAQLEKVSLTSIEHPSFFIGETATDALLEQIHNPNLAVLTRKTITPRIVERTSVRSQ